MPQERLPLARVLTAALALWLAGCASVPRCPRKGGPAWSEWATPNYRIWTDLGEGGPMENTEPSVHQITGLEAEYPTMTPESLMP